MHVSYFQPILISFLIIFFSCDNSKRNFNGTEITIEKKRIDSTNFEAKVIIKDKFQPKSKDEVYILIDNESKLDSQIRNLKEKHLNYKEDLN